MARGGKVLAESSRVVAVVLGEMAGTLEKEKKTLLVVVAVVEFVLRESVAAAGT